MATDTYATWDTPPPGPCRNAAAITTSDETDLSAVTRALYVGGAGDIVAITAAGEVVSLKGALAGSILPVAVSRVKATGTTATNLVALW